MKNFKNIKVKSNKSLSFSKVEDNFVVVNINGHFKTLECNYNIFKNILNEIDNYNRLGPIIDLYKDKYGHQNVEKFLRVLMAEEIVVKVELEQNSRKTNVFLIGSGILIDKTERFIKRKLKLRGKVTVDQFLNDPQYKYDVAIIIPGKIKYADILKLNNLFVKEEKPFILMYFDGLNLVLGPFVFPWKTPCFQCHVRHHINILNRKGKKQLKLSDIKELYLSKHISKEFTAEQINSAIQLIIHDVSKITKIKTNFIFFKKEIIIRSNIDKKFTKRIFEPIIDCSSCHGMNKNFHYYTGKVPKIKSIDKVIKDEKIKYRVGGFRSKSLQETEKMVKNALEKLDLKIKIKKVKKNPFCSVLPVYDSVLKTTHKNKTPYFFNEQVSHGKGLAEKQAYFSAFFELFERLSARYYGEKEIVRGTVKEVSSHNIELMDITSQIDKLNKVYDDYSPDIPIDWVWGQSLITGKAKLVPAVYAFLSDSIFKGNFVSNGSSGLSAGATLIDSILQGLFEVIEHDSWMIGQANPINLPIVKYGDLENEKLIEIIKKIKVLGFNIISRDYTSDIGIPVIRTWISNPNDYNNYAYNGFGCSVYPEIALERSITEAVQGFFIPELKETTKYRKVKMVKAIENKNSLFGLYYFQQKDIVNKGKTIDIGKYHKNEFNSVDEILTYVIRHIRKAIPGCDIVYVNLTRKSFGIPAVKVIVTGNIQWLSEPLITVRPRLYNFQKNKGYSEGIPEYKELYLGPYPH